MRRAAAALAILATALCGALGAAACTGKKIPRRGELRARVVPAAPGQAVTDDDVRLAAGKVDAAILELGIQRREVNPLPGGRLRIVLAESAAARVPDVRRRLADPEFRIELDPE